MSIIPITIFFSLALAGLFIVLFAHVQRRRGLAGAERDSLLPLAEEASRAAKPERHPHHDEAAHGEPCGCRSGIRPPCPGCRKGASISPANLH